VALARWSIAVDELMQGQLVLLFPRVAPLATGRGYYVVTPRENLHRRAVVAFRDWILAEAQSLRERTLVRERTAPPP
jgi:DNA-binding transcriptional LysR family regulator